MKVDEKALWEKALDLMPRGTQTMSKCPDQFVDGVYPKFVSHGKGTRLYGLDGRDIGGEIERIAAGLSGVEKYRGR